jgi:hypothetical protein
LKAGFVVVEAFFCVFLSPMDYIATPCFKYCALSDEVTQ